jgi:C-terminal processing protease CtpA/Prc
LENKPEVLYEGIAHHYKNDAVVNLLPYSDRQHIYQDPVWRTGIQVDIFDAGEIAFVQAQSPAWQAGIRQGDRLLAINGDSIDALGYFGVYALLEDPTITEFRIRIESPGGQTGTYLVPCPP